MKYYGTKDNKNYGFYEENFENAIEITDAYWDYLLNSQSEGKRIIPYENSVIAADEAEYSFENGKWKKLNPEETETKKLQIQNEKRASQIRYELEKLDTKRIRAIAEPSQKDENTSWLDYYNAEVKKLRDELAQIS